MFGRKQPSDEPTRPEEVPESFEHVPVSETGGRVGLGGLWVSDAKFMLQLAADGEREVFLTLTEACRESPETATVVGKAVYVGGGFIRGDFSDMRAVMQALRDYTRVSGISESRRAMEMHAICEDAKDAILDRLGR